MKFVFLLFGWLLVMSSPMSAQTPQDTLTNSLQKGARAIQFRVQSNFTLGALDGAVFSGKWHTDGQRAIRLGVSFTGRFSNTTNETSQTTTENGDAGTAFITINDNESDVRAWSVSLNSYYLIYPDSNPFVNVYAGAGPTLLWSKNNNDVLSRSIRENRQQGTERTEITESDNTGDQIRAGLGFIFGVEWFMNPNMSLTAEYGLSALYSFFSSETRSINTESDSEIERTSNVERSTDQFDLRADGVRFGLSIYF